MPKGPREKLPAPPPGRGPGILPLAVLAVVVATAGFVLSRDTRSPPPPTATPSSVASEPPAPVREDLGGNRTGVISCTVEYQPVHGPAETAEARFDIAGTGETIVRRFADLSVFFSYAHLPETTARIFVNIRTSQGTESLASATALAPDQMIDGETILRLGAVSPDTGSTLDTSCRLDSDESVPGSG